MATTSVIPHADRSFRNGHGRAFQVARACASILVLGTSTGAFAQYVLRLTPSIGATVTWTDNVRVSQRENRESDLVFLVRPLLAIDYRAPRASLQGTVAVPVVIHTQVDEEDKVYASVNLNGNVELIEDHFFVDAAAYVSQTYYSPFGARPSDLTNITDNRYTTQTYRVSPYAKGTIGSDVSWLIRNDSTWTNLNDSPQAAQGQFINRLFATINREPRPFGWGADIERTDYRFQDQQQTQVVALARARATWRADAQFQAYVSAGYERTDFPFFETEGVIYGAGFRWRPTERTRLDAEWEHRFFGESYGVRFEHRRPLSFWSFRAYRRLASYPERFVSLQEGANVADVLDRILQSRIPDEDERARVIEAFIENRGLPETLDQPINIYARQFFVVDYAAATAGLLGARNTLLFTVYRSRQKPITGAGQEIPPELSGFDNNTQYGVGTAWSYQLAPSATFTLGANASLTEAEPPFSARSEQLIVRALYTKSFSPRTTTFSGVRWQDFDSNGGSGGQEFAVFAGFNHRFW